jgi:hypothetical protein
MTGSKNQYRPGYIARRLFCVWIETQGDVLFGGGIARFAGCLEQLSEQKVRLVPVGREGDCCARFSF